MSFAAYSIELLHLPHLTTCSDPLGHAADAFGEVIAGLNTMSSCAPAAEIGAAPTSRTTRSTTEMTLKNMALIPERAKCNNRGVSRVAIGTIELRGDRSLYCWIYMSRFCEFFFWLSFDVE